MQIATERMKEMAPGLLFCLRRAVEYFDENGGDDSFPFLRGFKATISQAEGSDQAELEL